MKFKKNYKYFNHQLHFKYEEELRIDIVPFDFQDEAKSLKNFRKSFSPEIIALVIFPEGIKNENIYREIEINSAIGNEIW